MKYGIIIQNYGDQAKRMSGYNLGDGIQTAALLKLYESMNIAKEDIKGIRLYDINSYDGEYVVLPILSFAVGIGFAELPFPDKIIPVFISTHIAITELQPEQVDYLKKYAPIGCRDEFSLRTMRRYGIDSYLSGCITIIFDKERNYKEKKKIFFIDTPKELDAYIPQEIKERVVYGSHLYPLASPHMSEQEAEKLYRLSIEQLRIYREEASLVVSSRMHAIVPCIAMGIPVIAAFENISHRFSWLDKYLRLYTIPEFSEIDWNPDMIDCEDIKRKVIRAFAARIQEVYERYNDHLALSEFYENRPKAYYGNRYHQLLSQIGKDREEAFPYIIWGCGLIGNSVYKEMSQLYPNAILVSAVDTYKEGEWHGVSIMKPCLLENGNEFIILASYSGREQGYGKMKEFEKIEGKDYVYVATING